VAGPPVILVDSNIPMYLVGIDGPRKIDAQTAVERLISNRERLVSDAEVLQEVLHRYVSINRRDAIQPAFEVLYKIVDSVLPVETRSVNRAKEIILSTPGLSARDAIHLAIMEIYGIGRILSFDAGFDRFPGISRIS
jgi:uncharacterized protein